jgi:putative two-component system response regulator
LIGEANGTNGAKRGPQAPRVLVVDDDEGVRDLVARIMGDHGYVVDLADCAAEARSLAAENEFDLAICDVHMPGDSGLRLAGELRGPDHDVAVLMLSGISDPSIAEMAADQGAFGYLTKPFTENQLLINVANVIRRHRHENAVGVELTELERAVAERTAELEASNQALRDSRKQTIRYLARAVELRDRETGGHAGRIGETTALIADEFGLDAEAAELLGEAAIMHDVGKIGTPDSVLRKPGPLEPEERKTMQEHTVLGHELLAGSGVELLDLAAEVALTHHERFDGSGYPAGLVGDEIPISGRIVAVADVFDALTSDRVYRPRFAMETALEMMREGAGTQFDAGVVDAFFRRLPEVVTVR